MREIKINAFEFNELDERAKLNVISWLDKSPIYFEIDGEEEIEYFHQMEENEISEHCQANEYLFNKHGRPIHHLEIK